MRESRKSPPSINSEKSKLTKGLSQGRKVMVLLIAPTQDAYLGGQAIQASRLLENFQNESEIQVDFQSVNPRFFPRLQKIKYLRTFLRLTKYIFDLFITELLRISQRLHFFYCRNDNQFGACQVFA